MTGGSRRDNLPGRFASPPCLASKIAPDYFDPLAVDSQQALDVGAVAKRGTQAPAGGAAPISRSRRGPRRRTPLRHISTH